MKTTKERIIYQSEYFDDATTEEEHKRDFREYLEGNDYSEEEIEKKVNDAQALYDWRSEQNTIWFNDEILNLGKNLPTRIICIADLGLWDGRKRGYKELRGYNLNGILRAFGDSCDYIKFFADRYDVRATGIHHDGTNHILFRAWKESTTDAQQERVRNALYYDKDDADILVKKYTRSIRKDVAGIYGW